MVDSAARVSPSASGSTVNSETPPGVRAATMTRSAVWPSSTYILTPSSRHDPLSAVAAMVMPGSSQRPFCSVKASVALVSPEAMPGRWACLAASSPQCIRVLAASTAEEKYGAHSSARPISSSTTTCSTLVKPWPPYSSGTVRAGRPICSDIWAQTSGSKPRSVSICSRTADSGDLSSRKLRTNSLSCSCSSVNAKFTVESPRGNLLGVLIVEPSYRLGRP